MTFKSEMQALAKELINNVFGEPDGGISRTVTLVNPALSGYDPVLDQEVSSEATKDVVAILKARQEIAEQELVSGDVKYYSHDLSIPYLNLEGFVIESLVTQVRAGSETYMVVDTGIGASESVFRARLRRIK